MKFQTAKRDLELALQVVNASLASSGQVEMMTHYLFRVVGEGDGASVEILTYSGRIFSACPLKAKLEDPGEGAITVSGKRLKSWLDSVQDDGVVGFTSDEAIVKVESGRNYQNLQSLDPSQFPYWDKILTSAKVTAKLPAGRMTKALEYSRMFISDKEGTHPDFCVCEVKDGILYSTDQLAAALVRVTGLEKSNLRIHGKAVGGFLSFLGTCKSDSDVEILEHDRALVMRRWDGAVFGESRFQASFPTLKISMDEADQRVWTVSKDAILRGVKALVAGADDKDDKIQVTFVPDRGPLTLAMTSVATNADTTHDVPCIEVQEDPAGVPELPQGGFVVNLVCLRKVLSAWDGDGVKLRVNVMGARGFVRFVSELDGDTYLTIVAWSRSR